MGSHDAKGFLRVLSQSKRNLQPGKTVKNLSFLLKIRSDTFINVAAFVPNTPKRLLGMFESS